MGSLPVAQDAARGQRGEREGGERCEYALSDCSSKYCVLQHCAVRGGPGIFASPYLV